MSHAYAERLRGVKSRPVAVLVIQAIRLCFSEATSCPTFNAFFPGNLHESDPPCLGRNLFAPLGTGV